MNTKFFAFAIAALLSAALFGCLGQGALTPTELKESFSNRVGEEVLVKGVVKNSLKIGSLSAFQLADDASTIGVSSDSLPAEGKTVVVKGTVVKDTLFGYYVLAKQIT